MNGPFLLLVLLTLVGLVVTLRPYEVARFKERIDAVGSTRENDLASVEPTPQNVLVFRAFGFSMLVLGITFLLWLSFRYVRQGPPGSTRRPPDRSRAKRSQPKRLPSRWRYPPTSRARGRPSRRRCVTRPPYDTGGRDGRRAVRWFGGAMRPTPV